MVAKHRKKAGIKYPNAYATLEECKQNVSYTSQPASLNHSFVRDYPRYGRVTDEELAIPYHAEKERKKEKTKERKRERD